MKTKTNKQTKTKTNRDTQRSATHLSTFTLYQLFEDKDKWTKKDKQTNKDKDKQRHRGLLHIYQLSPCTSYLKTKTNKQTKTNRQTKTRTNNEPEVCYTPVKFHSVDTRYLMK